MRLAVLAWCAAVSSVACARGTARNDSTGIDAGDPDAAASADAALPEPDAALPEPDAAEPADAAAPDAATPDAATQDAAIDAGGSDAMIDAAIVDAGTIDASGADAQVDAGTTCAHAATGTLLTFDFTGQPGNQATTTPSSNAAGITGGAIARAAALTAVSGNNSINASGWALGSSRDGTRYFTFTLTPDPTCVLDLTSISVDSKASTTGPASGAVATSADGFASTKSLTINATSPVALSVSGAAGAIEVRVYGFAATSASGTMRLQGTLTLAGALR